MSWAASPRSKRSPERSTPPRRACSRRSRRRARSAPTRWTPHGGSQDEEAGETVGEALGVAEDGFERAEDRASLQALLRCLSAREREIVRLRFEEDLTQAEVGERVGLSQMHISRILRQAIERLRPVAGVDATAPSGITRAA